MPRGHARRRTRREVGERLSARGCARESALSARSAVLCLPQLDARKVGCAVAHFARRSGAVPHSADVRAAQVRNEVPRVCAALARAPERRWLRRRCAQPVVLLRRILREEAVLLRPAHDETRRQQRRAVPELLRAAADGDGVRDAVAVADDRVRVRVGGGVAEDAADFPAVPILPAVHRRIAPGNGLRLPGNQ